MPLPMTVATVKTSTQHPIFEWMKEGGSPRSPNASNRPSASRPPASPYLLGGRSWKGFEFFSAPFSPATPIRNNSAHLAKQDFTARTVSISSWLPMPVSLTTSDDSPGSDDGGDGDDGSDSADKRNNSGSSGRYTNTGSLARHKDSIWENYRHRLRHN